MIKKNFTARYSRVHNMLKGLKSHTGQFSKYGATPEFLNQLTGIYAAVNQIQKQRRAIKKTSLEATAAKNHSLKEAEKLCGKARKWIRLELPADAWPEFGFKKGEYQKEKKSMEKSNVHCKIKE